MTSLHVSLLTFHPTHGPTVAGLQSKRPSTGLLEDLEFMRLLSTLDIVPPIPPPVMKC